MVAILCRQLPKLELTILLCIVLGMGWLSINNTSTNKSRPELPEVWQHWLDLKQVYVVKNHPWYESRPQFIIAVLFTDRCHDMMIVDLVRNVAGGKKSRKWKVVVYVHNLLEFTNQMKMIRKYCDTYVAEGSLEIVTPISNKCSSMGNYLDCTIATRWQFVNAISLFYYTVVLSDFIIYLDQCFTVSPTFVTDVESFMDDIDSPLWITVDLYTYGMTGSLMRADDLEDFVSHALQQTLVNTEGSLSLSDTLDDYINNLYPQCDATITNRCIQELGLARLVAHPSLINITGPGTLVDTNHVTSYEPWPWMEAPIYVNPPCRCRTILRYNIFILRIVSIILMWYN